MRERSLGGGAAAWVRVALSMVVGLSVHRKEARKTVLF
jgi:hypothetical protein